MESEKAGPSSDIDSVISSDSQWSTCQIGLEILDKLMVFGHHLQGKMIKDYLKDFESLEGAVAVLLSKSLDLQASSNILENIGAHIGSEDSKGNNILHSVAHESNADKVRLILQTERKLNVRTNSNGFPALFVSADAGAVNALKVILEHGANHMWRDPSGNSALHFSIRAGHSKCADALLAAGAPVDAQNCAGETPLFCASEAGHHPCVALLIKKGAKVNFETRFGKIALHAAAAHGHSNCIQALVEAGSDVNKAAAKKWTPLHSAVEGGCGVEGIRFLLTEKVDINAKTEDGNTCLHICAAKGASELLQALLEHDPVPNLGEGNEIGQTALQTAIANKHLQCMELLWVAEKEYCKVKLCEESDLPSVHQVLSSDSTLLDT